MSYNTTRDLFPTKQISDCASQFGKPDLNVNNVNVLAANVHNTQQKEKNLVFEDTKKDGFEFRNDVSTRESNTTHNRKIGPKLKRTIGRTICGREERRTT